MSTGRSGASTSRIERKRLPFAATEAHEGRDRGSVMSSRRRGSDQPPAVRSTYHRRPCPRGSGWPPGDGGCCEVKQRRLPSAVSAGYRSGYSPENGAVRGADQTRSIRFMNRISAGDIRANQI
jgi:hypothetical protein